jgi:hypothetical protein
MTFVNEPSKETSNKIFNCKKSQGVSLFKPINENVFREAHDYILNFIRKENQSILRF